MPLFVTKLYRFFRSCSYNNFSNVIYWHTTERLSVFRGYERSLLKSKEIVLNCRADGETFKVRLKLYFRAKKLHWKCRTRETHNSQYIFQFVVETFSWFIIFCSTRINIKCGTIYFSAGTLSFFLTALNWNTFRLQVLRPLSISFWHLHFSLARCYKKIT